MNKSKLHICTGRWCSELGSERIFDRIKRIFKEHVIPTEVVQCKCLGYCDRGVNAMKNGRVYHELTEENAIEEVMGEGRPRGDSPNEIEDDFLGDI